MLRLKHFSRRTKTCRYQTNLSTNTKQQSTTGSKAKTKKKSGKRKHWNKKFETPRLKKNSFFFLLNTFHHIKFWKNLMNRFWKIFAFLDPKMFPLHRFELSMNFIKNLQNHFYQLFNASHQVQFRKTWLTDFGQTWILDRKMTHFKHNMNSP